jgi:hypothetical protein
MPALGVRFRLVPVLVPVAFSVLHIDLAGVTDMGTHSANFGASQSYSLNECLQQRFSGPKTP